MQLGGGPHAHAAEKFSAAPNGPTASLKYQVFARDPRPAAQAPSAQQPASSQASVADVFASMMSQVSGREVRAVPPPPPGRPAPGAPTVGRNDPCPCGSGKKYKKCCGKNL